MARPTSATVHLDALRQPQDRQIRLGSRTFRLVANPVLTARLVGDIEVPGYAATVLAVMFFGALNTLGIGLVGTYAWRAYENSKQRPLAVVQSLERFGD